MFFFVNFWGIGIMLVFGIFGLFIGLMFWRIKMLFGEMFRLGLFRCFVMFVDFVNIMVLLVCVRSFLFFEVLVFMMVFFGVMLFFNIMSEEVG